MKKLNCWEFTSCGREEGGLKCHEMGVCPAATDSRLDGVNSGVHGGRSCWAVAGTMCGGKIQGTNALLVKEGCAACEFYKLVAREEGIKYQNTKEIAKIMNRIFFVGLPIMLKSPHLQEEKLTNIIGWDYDSCLIAKLPYAEGRPVKLQKDDDCQVKFAKDGEAFGFTSRVISIQSYPIPLIFLRYPVHLRKTPFRGNKRRKINATARLLQTNGDCAHECIINDISETGCQVKIIAETTTVFTMNEQVALQFAILSHMVGNQRCEVRNIERTENILSLGLVFKDLSSSTRESIRAVLALMD